MGETLNLNKLSRSKETIWLPPLHKTACPNSSQFVSLCLWQWSVINNRVTNRKIESKLTIGLKWDFLQDLINTDYYVRQKTIII